MSDPAAEAHHHATPKTPPSTAAFIVRKLPSAYINSFCGAAAGVASGVVTCPLDVIKTKLQAQGSFRRQQHQQHHLGLKAAVPSSTAVYRGLVGTARTIVRQDGLRGMYRGLGPMLLGYLPTWAVYMSIYDIAKTAYSPHIEPQWLAYIASSVTAGACSTLATNPIWVIKTRLMSQVSANAGEGHRTPWHYNNTWDAARQMYKSEGIKAFYSGLAPALLGLTHVAIQFPLYEYLKLKFTGVEMGAAPPSQSTNSIGVLGATCISKICATTATYPHEVLRTRLQTQQRGVPSSDGMINKPRYQGVLRTCRTILYEEGWTAFYNGMGTNLIRAVPAAMTTMLTFETLKSVIVRLQTEDDEHHAQSL